MWKLWGEAPLGQREIKPMGVYKLALHRTAVQTVEVEVEAGTPQEAMILAEQKAMDIDFSGREKDSTYEAELLTFPGSDYPLRNHDYGLTFLSDRFGSPHNPESDLQDYRRVLQEMEDEISFVAVREGKIGLVLSVEIPHADSEDASRDAQDGPYDSLELAIAKIKAGLHTKYHEMKDLAGLHIWLCQGPFTFNARIETMVFVELDSPAWEQIKEIARRYWLALGLPPRRA